MRKLSNEELVQLRTRYLNEIEPFHNLFEQLLFQQSITSHETGLTDEMKVILEQVEYIKDQYRPYLFPAKNEINTQ